MARVEFNFPEELVMEILCWLPVLSLLQVKSVCKSWKAIVSDPKFTKTHSYRREIMANDKASILLLTDSRFSRQHRSSPDFNYYLLEPNECRVIGSCNGIICLENIRFFYLWNPATKQGKTLAKFPRIEKAITNVHRSVKVAFGFDTVANDYKILKFLCPAINANVVPVVQLYSTSTGTGKEINVHVATVSEILCHPYLQLGPVIKGALYMSRRGKLVSFNLHSELFSVFSFPSSMLRYSEVLDFEGSVAVISGSVDEGSGISLWTLDDTPGKVSWTKKFMVRNDIGWVYSYVGGGLLYGRVPFPRHYRDGSNPVDIFYAGSNKKAEHQVRNLSAVLKYRETLTSIDGFKPVPDMFPWFNPRD